LTSGCNFPADFLKILDFRLFSLKGLPPNNLTYFPTLIDY